MIAKALKYGYMSTGKAYLFLRILDDDPSVVFYSVCAPNADIEAEEEGNKLHRTAVAQVFAFVLGIYVAEHGSCAALCLLHSRMWTDRYGLWRSS